MKRHGPCPPKPLFETATPSAETIPNATGKNIFQRSRNIPKHIYSAADLQYLREGYQQHNMCRSSDAPIHYKLVVILQFQQKGYILSAQRSLLTLHAGPIKLCGETTDESNNSHMPTHLGKNPSYPVSNHMHNGTNKDYSVDQVVC